MSLDDPFGRISTYYEKLVSQYGHDPRACDYGRPESQAIKFKVLADISDLSHKKVLDVGCGFADFAGYLQRRYTGVSYTGIDITESMIRQARLLRPDLDLRVGNFATTAMEDAFDVVMANGIFYLMSGSAFATMKEIIRRMFELSRVAVAFNSLSSWTSDQEADEFYADPLATVEFCRTLTPRVTLRHDYHPRDFTVYLYKAGPQ